MLAAILRHRFLTTAQLRVLLFEGASVKRVQQRLRKLWLHGLIDRYFVPLALGDARSPDAKPLYYLTLTNQGFDLIADGSVGERPRAPNPVMLQHDALVVEFLVAMQVACRGRLDIRLERVEAEWLLWQRIGALRQRGQLTRGYLVPDAAVTLTFPALGKTQTFYFEMVRADVKGGNRRLQEKLRRYVVLHRQGFFRQAFGHEQLRAVIIATTSAQRAEHFRQLAAGLAHGRQLFWFGVAEEKDQAGQPLSTLTPDTILGHRWTAVDGQLLSFIPPGAADAAAPLF